MATVYLPLFGQFSHYLLVPLILVDHVWVGSFDDVSHFSHLIISQLSDRLRRPVFELEHVRSLIPVRSSSCLMRGCWWTDQMAYLLSIIAVTPLFGVECSSEPIFALSGGWLCVTDTEHLDPTIKGLRV